MVRAQLNDSSLHSVVWSWIAGDFAPRAIDEITLINA